MYTLLTVCAVITGLCPGRTNIINDNAYKTEIAPMAEKSPLVLRAILALSATYMMDFHTSPRWKKRAQQHHEDALDLLSQELHNQNNYNPGQELAVVAALTLLAHNEVCHAPKTTKLGSDRLQIINWEESISKRAQSPSWYRSGKQAEYLLEMANPAYKYADSDNVQCSKSRFALGQMFCLDNVMSDCLYPLDLAAKKCGFSWLLDGGPIQKNKIVGMTGLSPQLMHYFAKITFLSAQLYKVCISTNMSATLLTLRQNPAYRTSNKLAIDLEVVLDRTYQWSDITHGYESSSQLLENCDLDENDKVTTHEEVTDLIAECYKAAAQIYLQCRALR